MIWSLILSQRNHSLFLSKLNVINSLNALQQILIEHVLLSNKNFLKLHQQKEDKLMFLFAQKKLFIDDINKAFVREYSDGRKKLDL